MTRPAFLLPLALALAACATGPVPLPPPDAEVRPLVGGDRLDGSWTVRAINGQAAAKASLTLRGADVSVRLPCNSASGSMTRNGDKLFVTALAMTEMACLDPRVSAAEEQMIAVLRLPMTGEFRPPSDLRLVNEAGTLDLVRQGG